MGDKGYLSRAIFNLIENAVKYSYHEGEILVHIFVNNKWVYLNVLDKGVGVESKDVDVIFEDYRRSGEYNMAQGHGLGLALVKAVAEIHGGNVSCKSELGLGSHFIFKIPRLED